MLTFVSLPIELVRTAPRALVLAAVLAQAALWVVVPTLIYLSPPGDMPETLAIGHKLLLGGPFGPPLAFWLAELAFRAFGLFGVYLLAQACVTTALLAVFALGRAAVGESHAALAVLAMVAMAVFAVPAPAFDPSVLTLPLWALLLLHLWRAVGEGRGLFWLAVGVEAGLLVLTSYANLGLLLLAPLFLLIDPQGRAQFGRVELFVGVLLAMAVVFPHLMWLDSAGSAPLLLPASAFDYARALMWLVFLLVASGLALALQAALARGLPGAALAGAPAIVRASPDPFARRFVLFFALAPLFAVLPVAAMPDRSRATALAPLLLLAALGVVVALGDRIRVVHQRPLVGFWLAMVAIPPLAAVAAVALSAWFPVLEPRTGYPSVAMGRFFGESFERRTGRPLSVVSGDPSLAALVALGASSRPDVFRPEAPERSPWVTLKDVQARGAVVLWRATDTRGLPPADVVAAWPGLVPEVPQAFETGLDLLRPPLRIGWGVIRPPSATPPSATSPSASSPPAK